mgnify:CR=1 FL=1
MAAPCHPHRRIYAAGKCRSCYDAARHERRPELLESRRIKQAVYHKAYYQNNKSKIVARRKTDRQGLSVAALREISLRQRYGMTLEDYDAMLEAQGGVCAICAKPPRGKSKGRRLYVDHCHDTKIVRGLLCAGCNTALGQFYHDPAIFARAIAYLEQKR